MPVLQFWLWDITVHCSFKIPPQQPNIQPNNLSPANPRQNSNNDCRPTTQQACPVQQPNHGTRPPFRPFSSNNKNQRHPPNNNNTARQNPSTSNAANIVCNNCGRLGRYAYQCITTNSQPQTNNNNRGGPPIRNTNNENAVSCNQHAYLITNLAPSQSNAFHHQAYMAFSDYQTTFHSTQTVSSWPDTNTQRMQNNRALLRNDFLPTAQAHPTHVPQNSSLMTHYQPIRN